MISKNQIKYIKDLSRKSVRNQERKFIVEGEKLVKELIQGQIEIDQLYALATWIDENPQVKASEVTEKELSRISQLKSPNKVLAVVPMFEDEINDDVENGLVLFLDRINDPGNLGTIIRMADWFNIQKVVCTEGSVDVYNAKVIQSSMGSAFRVPVFYTEAIPYLEKYRTMFPENIILGAEMDGVPLAETELPANGLLIMGSESHGIDEGIQDYLTQSVTIPRMGFAESLNVAVATSIILWEWRRS